MSEGMVERVARAIDGVYFAPGRTTHEQAKRAASAAIEAMKTPTEAMEEDCDMEKRTETCKFCGKQVAMACRNTRDMDPEDGFNHTHACNEQLVKMGGGERRRTKAEALR